MSESEGSKDITLVVEQVQRPAPCRLVDIRENMDDPGLPEEVVAFIGDHPGCDILDIADELGLTLAKARELTRDLMAQGRITHEEPS